VTMSRHHSAVIERLAANETASVGDYIGMIGGDAMLQLGAYPLVRSVTTATGEIGEAVGTV